MFGSISRWRSPSYFPSSLNTSAYSLRICWICTRLGCATASCTWTEVPVPLGFGDILSILKLVRFLQLRFPSVNTRQFHSPLSSAVCEEVVEWLVAEYSRDQRLSSRITVHRLAKIRQSFDHVHASKSLSITLARTLSSNSRCRNQFFTSDTM